MAIYENRRGEKVTGVEKRGDNSYRFQAYDGAGKRHYYTWTAPEGLSPKKLDDAITEEYANFKRGIRGEGVAHGKMKLSEWYEFWMNGIVNGTIKNREGKNYAPKSALEWSKFWPRINEKLGHLRLDKITSPQIQGFYDHLQNKVVNTRTGGRLSPSTVRHYHVMLHLMFKVAKQKKIIAKNPCDAEELTAAPKIPKLGEIEVKHLEPEQVDKLTAALEREPLIFRVMVLLYLETGMRKGELHGLQWGDYKAEKDILWVRRELQYLEKQGVAERPPKSAKSVRPIALSPEMIALLNEWREEQARWREAVGDDVWNTEFGRGGEILPGDWMFTDEYGNPRYPGSFLSRFKAFLKRAGFSAKEIKDTHTHTLRHTSATLLIADGVDPATTAARLGHAQISTTLNIYTHSIAETNAAAGAKMGSRLHKSKEKIA